MIKPKKIMPLRVSVKKKIITMQSLLSKKTIKTKNSISKKLLNTMKKPAKKIVAKKLFEKKTILKKNTANQTIAKQNIANQIIAKKNLAKKQVLFHERKIFGVGKPITQRTYFNKKQNKIIIKLIRNNAELGKLNIGLINAGNQKIAYFSDAHIKKTMRGKGLYTQIVAEALDTLKKSGVSSIRFEATGGHSVLKKMGFESKSQFGDRIYWKNI